MTSLSSRAFTGACAAGAIGLVTGSTTTPATAAPASGPTALGRQPGPNTRFVLSCTPTALNTQQDMINRVVVVLVS